MTLGKIADPEKRNVNLNVLVIGGSGSGKTRYHIKPNLLQMNASYVCSDPKGTVVEEVGRALVPMPLNLSSTSAYISTISAGLRTK